MLSHFYQELLMKATILINIDTIQKTLRANGNVLLPVDTAGRVLELIQILEWVSWGKINILSSFLLFLVVLVAQLYSLSHCYYCSTGKRKV